MGAAARRRVTVVTTSRADFGIYAPVIAELRRSATLGPDLLVSGNHVPAEADVSAREAEAERLAGAAELQLAGVVPMPLGTGDAGSIARAMAAVMQGAGALFERDAPDILLVLGDRYEMHAVVAAASAFRIPVAHIHGGEESVGALDNAYRHSISKLSHLHFCATETSRLRLLQMGEDDWRVTVTGAPALDGIDALPLLSREALFARLDLPDTPFLLGTFHPETVAIEKTLPHFDALIAALDRRGMTAIFSRANADEAGREINARLEDYAARMPWLHVRDNLGRLAYFSAMRQAEAMVGNSSSGIIEAASFGLPVVNVGDRQEGRERSANTIDSPGDDDAIAAAVTRALADDFRAAARTGGNVYFRGNAARTICEVLERQALDRNLLAKAFAWSRPEG